MFSKIKPRGVIGSKREHTTLQRGEANRFDVFRRCILKSSLKARSDNCHKALSYAGPCRYWAQKRNDPTVARFIALALRRRKETSRGKRRTDLARRYARGSSHYPGLDRQATLRKPVR